MQRVFISNTAVQESGDIKIDGFFDIANLPIEKEQKDGNTIFVIDVHCTFNQLKLQEQGGVIIYRHLLNQFKDCQDKLKVVFYSPISKEHLAALRPENYVLTLLPFVQCEYDGNFAKALQEEIDKNAFVQFNNASENLLSGWSLNQKQYVETYFLSDEESEKPKNEQTPVARSIAVIDDQLNEWTTTFKNIFEPKTKFRFLLYNNSKGTKGNFDKTKIENLTDPKTAYTLTDQIKDIDLVLSDFYLEEPHESNNWMSSEELSTKSGFQLFETIKGKKGERGISKGIPYVMHTSSNKIQYLKFLDSNGVDNWLIKDTRPDTPIQQKRENYFAFKKEIEKYTSLESSELYVSLRKIWKQIELLESPSVPVSWWDSNTKKPSIINLLKNSWMALRAYVNKEEYFATNIGSNDKNFTPTAINSNLGKILEMDFKFGNTFDSNYFFHFLTQVRNASSHYIDYNFFGVADSLIYFESWLHALGNTNRHQNTPNKIFKTSNFTKEFMIQDNGGGTDETFIYRLLYVYLQYYNSVYSKETHLTKIRIKKRVGELLKLTDKKILLDEILNHNMPTDKSGRVKDGAVHLSEAIAKDLKNDPSLYFDLIEEKDKLFIINE